MFSYLEGHSWLVDGGTKEASASRQEG